MQEHGADLTATNNEGQTAMSLAVGVGNKNGKFTFIDFQWLSFWVALNGFKTNVTRETVSGPPSRPMGRRSRWQKQHRKFSLPGLQELAKLRASRLKFQRWCISWTLHKKKKLIGCFSVRYNIRWLLHLSPSLFSASGARKEKKNKSSAREREKKAFPELL